MSELRLRQARCATSIAATKSSAPPTKATKPPPGERSPRASTSTRKASWCWSVKAKSSASSIAAARTKLSWPTKPSRNSSATTRPRPTWSSCLSSSPRNSRGRAIRPILMRHFVELAAKAGKRSIHLMCRERHIALYRKFGYRYVQPSPSDHGGMIWHEMVMELGG